MQILIIFIMYMVLFYSVYKVMFLLKGKKKKDDLSKINEIYLLERYFKVDVKKIGLNKMLNIVALSNAFIFSVVLLSTSLIDNLIIRIIVMFVLLFPVIYLVYYGVSICLKKKGN